MSMSEILEEVSKLSTEDRHLLFTRLNELEEALAEETPELLAAISEAREESESTDVTADKLRRDVMKWARTK